MAGLSHVPRLKVVRYRGQIPEQLGVEAVISGRVSVSAASLTLQLDLKDARNGSPLWQGTFERSGRPIEDLAVEVVGEIAGSAKLRTRKKARAIDPAVEKSYLRGRAQWNKRHPEAIRQAIALLSGSARDRSAAREVARRPGRRLPDARISPGDPATRRHPEGESGGAARDRAGAGPGRAACVARLPGRRCSTGTGRPRERELQRRCGSNPDYPWAPHWYGLLAAPKSLDESLTVRHPARDLDPLSPIIHTAVGIAHHLAASTRGAAHLHAVLETEARSRPRTTTSA